MRTRTLIAALVAACLIIASGRPAVPAAPTCHLVELPVGSW
ncbi:MAG TPA: hypothetical protein VGE07_23615 [Herpetosiphonaceae bacterium]